MFGLKRLKNGTDQNLIREFNPQSFFYKNTLVIPPSWNSANNFSKKGYKTKFMTLAEIETNPPEEYRNVNTY